MTHSAEHEHESGSSSSKDDLPLRLLLTSLFAGALLMRILSTSQPGSSSDALFASIFSVLALFLWRTGDDFSFTVEGLSTSRALGRVERLAMLWALLAAFSLSWSWHPAQSFRALSVVWSPVAVFLGLRALKHPEHLRVLYAVAIGGALQALNGLFQVFVQWPDALLRRHELSLPPSIVQRMETGRPIGMSLSPDLFGALCFAGGCASFALFIYARGERRRECTSPRPKKTFERFSSSPSMAELLWISFAGLSLAGVVASRSVGTFVAVGAAFSVFLLWSAQRHSRKYAIGILMLLLIVGGAGFGLVLYLRGSDALMHSLHERWLNWGVATRILLENPQGVGLDRFAAAYLEWRTPEGNVTRYAHSMWMQGAAELGVAFVLLSVAGLFGVVKQFRALLSKTFAPAALLLAGVLGWTLRASLDYDFQIAQTSTGWATLAGLALFWAPTFVAKGSSSDKASTGVKEKRGDDVDKEPILSPRNSLSLVAGFLLLSSVLSVVIFWQCRSLEQKRTVDERASLVENAFSQPCENALTVQAVGMLFYTPCEPTQCEEQRRQLTSLLESATSCPHPSAMSWRVQAMVFLGAGDDVKAEKALDEALRIDPGNLIGHQLRMKAAEAVVDVDRLRMRKKEALLWFSEEELRLRNWQLERHPLYP